MCILCCLEMGISSGSLLFASPISWHVLCDLMWKCWQRHRIACRIWCGAEHGPELWPRQREGSSVCQVTSIGVTVILLYTSRACYNLFILSFSQTKKVNSFDYDWYNVSDQADLKCQLGDAGYIVFGVILFVWELLPTSLVVYFFRVRNPTKDLANAGMVPSHGFNPRSYFFDNPRRYDSDDDLAWNIAPQGAQGSFSPDYYDWGHQNNSFMAYIGSLQQDPTLDTDRPSPI